MGRYLEHQGLFVGDVENSYLELEPRDALPMDNLLGHSITYRVAFDPHQGRKAFTLQTVPAATADPRETSQLTKAAGFSLHAGVVAQTHDRRKLERLCRYIARPAVSTKLL